MRSQYATSTASTLAKYDVLILSCGKCYDFFIILPMQITNESVCTMGQGDLVCGVCECDEYLDSNKPFTGPECQCPPPPPERTFFCA